MKKRAPTVASERKSPGKAGKRRRAVPASRRAQAAPALRGRSGPKLTNRNRTGNRGGTARTTIDHNEIRSWAEERGGKPATVKATVRGKQPAGIIRLDFPGYSGATSLKPITWEEWFEMFEDRQLALIYQDRTAQGKPSRFNKLVARKAKR